MYRSEQGELKQCDYSWTYTSSIPVAPEPANNQRGKSTRKELNKLEAYRSLWLPARRPSQVPHPEDAQRHCAQHGTQQTRPLYPCR